MTLSATEVAPQTLYRFFDDAGDLLYVGITANPGTRLAEHRADKPWWPEVATMSLERFDTRDDVAEAERAAIAVESPRYNVVRPLTARSAVRTVRVSDQLWEASQDTAWSRRETVSGAIRKSLEAYNADPDAFDKACSRITGKVER